MAIDALGTRRGLILYNKFYDSGFGAILVKGGSEDIEIRANSFVNTGHRPLMMGQATSDEYFRPPLSTTEVNYEAKNVRAYANYIEGGASGVAFDGCVECDFSNNTVVNPRNPVPGSPTFLIRILTSTLTHGGYTFAESSHGKINNNIFYYSRAQLAGQGEFINIGWNTQPETFTMNNNLWYAHDDAAQSAPLMPNFPVENANALIGLDPLFIDIAAGDFGLKAASPALGKGLAPAGPPHDYAGACYKPLPAIGARDL